MTTAERLRELLAYNPRTGLFTWRVSRKGRGGVVSAGSVAGTFDTRGSRVITVDNHKYPAARLAWFYVTGRWPTFNLVHVDGNTANDRFANLRPSARSLSVRVIIRDAA